MGFGCGLEECFFIHRLHRWTQMKGTPAGGNLCASVSSVDNNGLVVLVFFRQNEQNGENGQNEGRGIEQQRREGAKGLF